LPVSQLSSLPRKRSGQFAGGRSRSLPTHFDLAIVGAGIVGLAHALAAARRGKRVIVIERDRRPNGASIRNFGFITVTGQANGETWRLARRSRDVWAEIATLAGIAIEHSGLVVTMRRQESLAVAEAFLATEMGEGCARRGGIRRPLPGNRRSGCAACAPNSFRQNGQDGPQ
jgi:glycine/D-amino acid oxidase-like deaminating enzyme